MSRKVKAEVGEDWPDFFKVNEAGEDFLASVRSEAMLKVLLKHTAKIEAKQSWFKSWRKIYNRMMHEVKGEIDAAFERMDKYL